MNPLREKTEYFALKSVMGLLRLCPEVITHAIFRGFGAVFFILSGRRRRMTLRNLEIAFPEKSSEERKRIARRAFLNMAEFMADSFLLMAGKLSEEQITSRVDASDLKNLEPLLATANRGMLYLTGHLGNWELAGCYAAIRGFQTNVIARRGTNQLIDEKIIVPFRTRYGNKVFYKKNAMLNTVKALKRNESVSFLIDQKIGSKEGVPVRFFGREILAVASCATIQIRFNPLVVASFMIKTGPRKYKWIISAPVEWIDDGSPMEEQVQKLTQIHQNIIEQTIRKYPEQWFWMHNRFKLPKSGR